MNDESQVDIISSWNIAEYLPKKIQVSMNFSLNNSTKCNESLSWEDQFNGFQKAIHLIRELFLHV